MDGSPRVLSVTFGSFSCTVEGFDDPVATLIAVAEHFRELAERDPDFARGGPAPEEAALARGVEAAGAMDAPEVEPAGRAEEPSVAGGADEVGDEPGEPKPGEALRGAEPESIRPQPPVGEPIRSKAAATAPDAAFEGPGQAAAGTAGAAMASEVAEPAMPEAGRPDIDRLAAALFSSRGRPPHAGPAGARMPPSVPEASPAPEPLEIGTHDWGAEDPEEEDWPEEDDSGDDPVGADDGEAWTEGRFTARVLGRGATAPAGIPDGPTPPGREEPEPEGRRILATSPDKDEEALQRFLSQAERQLSDPEIARRHEAMAHLKAAVAATEAQRALGESAPDSESPFREEWAAVARPQNGRGAPPPLRLVASQRVDLPPEPARRPAPAAEPSAPLGAEPRPRADAAPTERGSLSFAAFAAQAGAAASLPDLLEAAAAWMAVVQGEEEASRSQLLRLAAEAMPEPPSREDALRVFGILLRTGRLARVEGGRFRAGDRTRFGPERHAG